MALALRALEVGGLGDEVQAEFDQLGAAFGRLPDLDGDHLVPGAADDHADSFLAGRHRVAWANAG